MSAASIGWCAFSASNSVWFFQLLQLLLAGNRVWLVEYLYNSNFAFLVSSFAPLASSLTWGQFHKLLKRILFAHLLLPKSTNLNFKYPKAYCVLFMSTLLDCKAHACALGTLVSGCRNKHYICAFKGQSDSVISNSMGTGKICFYNRGWL